MADRLGDVASLDVGLAQTIERCLPLVTRVCRSRLSGLPASDIEDAVQETFLQFVAADRTRIVNVRAWLITVALRSCAHTLRARYRCREVPLVDGSIVQSVGDAIHRADDRLWLAKVATLLPTTDRKLLDMLYLRDLPYDQVARSLQVSNGHARVLAYRAREHARVVIAGLE